MAESPEELLRSIKELDQRIASGSGDVLTRVRSGELRRRYRKETGAEAPRPDTPGVGLNFGPKNVHIGNINISGTGHAIAPGGVAFTGVSSNEPDGTGQVPYDYVRMLADAVARAGGDAERVVRENKLEDVFDSGDAMLEAVEAATVEVPPGPGRRARLMDGTPYPAPVCTVTCRDSDGKLLSHGTGFVIAPGLVLTCRHVLDKDLAAVGSVSFRFVGPSYDRLPVINGKVRYSHTFTAQATKRGEQIDLWADSPPFETQQDVENGNLDLALLEMDKSTEQWGVNIEASREVLDNVNAGQVLLQIVPSSETMQVFPGAAVNPEETQGVELLRIDPMGGIQRTPGSANSHGVWKVHTIDDTERGDSGAPLIVPEIGFVGMHTSRGPVTNEPNGELRGRFVHVHFIRNFLDANSGLTQSTHADNLSQRGWIARAT